MAMDKGKRKRVPPARERYEEDHPVVSVRISKEMREELRLVTDVSGMSIADVLRVGHDKAKPAVDEAFNEGYYEGYGYAQREFEVTFRCSECGERHLSITSEKAREAAAEYMYQHGWHDPKCR